MKMTLDTSVLHIVVQLFGHTAQVIFVSFALRVKNLLDLK